MTTTKKIQAERPIVSPAQLSTEMSPEWHADLKRRINVVLEHMPKNEVFPKTVPNETGRGRRYVIDHPAPNIYNNLTPQQVEALCEIDTPVNKRRTVFGNWDLQRADQKRYFRLKAYWTLRGAIDPEMAAYMQVLHEEIFNAEWHAECVVHGWIDMDWRAPKSLRELERLFLPQLSPDINQIIRRCPQMALIHALRGNVKEPYWWAALSITEHASPNFSRACSDGYPGFSDLELKQRADRIRVEGTKPALCSRLDGVNPNICVVCRFKGVVRSPIALGYPNEPKKGN